MGKSWTFYSMHVCSTVCCAPWADPARPSLKKAKINTTQTPDQWTPAGPPPPAGKTIDLTCHKGGADQKSYHPRFARQKCCRLIPSLYNHPATSITCQFYISNNSTRMIHSIGLDVIHPSPSWASIRRTSHSCKQYNYLSGEQICSVLSYGRSVISIVPPLVGINLLAGLINLA